MISKTTAKIINDLPAILSVRSVADFFSVHYRTVSRMIKRGELYARKDCFGMWSIKRQDLMQYCSKHSNL